MSSLQAPGLPEEDIRARARTGAAAAFPPVAGYGHTLYGPPTGSGGYKDPLQELRIVPPALMPRRLEKLVALGREPLHTDVALGVSIGGFASPLPIFLPAFGSSQAVGPDLATSLASQAGRLGIPMVIGENVVPVHGYGHSDASGQRSLLRRLEAYVESMDEDAGGIVVQQSTEDADAEVWNLLYSEAVTAPLLAGGRLAFELKIGQGAKPGLGGMTVLDGDGAQRLEGQYAIDELSTVGPPRHLRYSSPGTVTAEILGHQIRQMRNNYPLCRIWVKLPPTRDVEEAATVAWDAGADAVTVDGAEGGTGWAPRAFLEQVGLPLAECLRRIGEHPASLCVTGGMWEGTRALKCLALGATAIGLGRAALIAVDEDAEQGLCRLVECLELELRLLISALGKYAPDELDPEDLWLPSAAAAWPGQMTGFGVA
jgi:methylamine---glutamate N-methyltransferase subunit C